MKAHRVSPFEFFGTMRLFQNSKVSPKGSHFIFKIFCNNLDFQKAERVLPFTILQTLRFLNLRYSADFRRSRLVIISAIAEILLKPQVVSLFSVKFFA